VHESIALLGMLIAGAAAVRSTWSPCGQSMLSQITPVAEAGRRQRFGRTAAWFIFGAVAGGLTLGGVAAGLAAVVATADLTESAALAIAAGVTLASATIDSGVLGVAPPFFRRQVNEYWLSTYRAWVYGTGFGWQIGVGLATYIMTAAVVLIMLLGALTGSPWAALALGGLFGLIRGLAVLLGARVRTIPDLHAFHRRFDATAEPVRQAVIAIQLLVGIGVTWTVATPAVAGVTTLFAVSLLAWARYRTAGRDAAAAINRPPALTNQRAMA
jgi:hypothetical protein